MTSPKVFGIIGCYHKQRSHLISFNSQMQCQHFQHMHISADHLITTKCRSHRWDVRHRSTRRPTNVGHGHTIQSTDGIYSPPQNIIAHTHVMSKQLKQTPFGHRPFQTQKYNKPHHHTRRQSNASIGRMHQNNHRSHRRNNSTGGKRSPVHCNGNTGSTAQMQYTH
jgi:hypothetical protein